MSSAVKGKVLVEQWGRLQAQSCTQQLKGLSMSIPFSAPGFLQFENDGAYSLSDALHFWSQWFYRAHSEPTQPNLQTVGPLILSASKWEPAVIPNGFPRKGGEMCITLLHRDSVCLKSLKELRSAQADFTDDCQGECVCVYSHFFLSVCIHILKSSRIWVILQKLN